jgi:sarcosine oxidase subunit gamma
VTAESLARSPIADRLDDLARITAASAGSVAVAHLPFLAQVDVRLHAAEVERLPAPLPTEPNTAWEEGSRAALWLGPDEWLVLGPAHAGTEIAAEWEAAFGSIPHSVVDVSANRVALELSGPGVQELLSAGCSLDLDPRGGWIPGRCAQTLLARVPVILHERTEATRVLVRPSFAEYLVDWLIDAARVPVRP